MTTHTRYVCFRIAEDQIKSYASLDLIAAERIQKVLDMVGYCVHELTEHELCLFLAMGGVDLSDDLHRLVASDMVSWYVGDQIIELSELMPMTLLDLDSPLRQRAFDDPDMQAHAHRVKRAGLEFRTQVAPNVIDPENL